MDAGTAGARLTPTDAYRFARGEEVMSNTGQPVKLPGTTMVLQERAYTSPIWYTP